MLRSLNHYSDLRGGASGPALPPSFGISEAHHYASACNSGVHIFAPQVVSSPILDTKAHDALVESHYFSHIAEVQPSSVVLKGAVRPISAEGVIYLFRVFYCLPPALVDFLFPGGRVCGKWIMCHGERSLEGGELGNEKKRRKGGMGYPLEILKVIYYTACYGNVFFKSTLKV